MPGRGSYGKGGKWIHDRANHILGKNPDMPKGMAYAVATQQAHKTGKSPKKFRTKEGVRVALAKHSLPKKMSKKTASEKMKKVAFARLKRLRKLAETKRMPTTKGSFTVKPRKRRPPRTVRLPRGLEAKRRGKIQQRIFGGAPFKVQPKGTPGLLKRVGGSLGERALEGAGGLLSSRIANLGAGGAVPAAAAGGLDAAFQSPGVASGATGGRLLKNPMLRKALGVGGIGALGLGLGAGAHQLAHSVGLTDTGPADTLANIVVPSTPKYSHDIAATRGLGEGNMYVPRYFLEKAAASMAGAMDDNEGSMHEGEPGMFGPEASVIPQQTLETAVPITQHVEKSDEEADSFIQRMFENYKATKEESVGRYTKGETVIPLEKQAGRLLA